MRSLNNLFSLLYYYIYITTIVTEETFLVRLHYIFLIFICLYFLIYIILFHKYTFQLFQQPKKMLIVRSGACLYFNLIIYYFQIGYLHVVFLLNWILYFTAKSKTLSGRCSDSLSGSQSIRRTASLDTIYLKGQWPRDSYYMHSSLLVDKSTQVSKPWFILLFWFYFLKTFILKFEQYHICVT